MAKTKAETKAKEPAKKADLGLKQGKNYSFESNGKGPGMEKGKVYTVSAQVAQILFDKGFGEVKK